MSKDRAGAANFERRAWDDDAYAAAAAARAAAEEAGESVDAGGSTTRAGTLTFQPATTGAAGPAGSERAYLKWRGDADLKLEATLNTRRVVADGTAGGYYCNVCDCTLKDSMAWLDHINGKNHQRKLGYSMRVERSTVGSVQARLEALKRAKLGASGSGPSTSGPGKEGGDHRPVMDADDAAAMAAMRTSKQRHGVGDKRKAETGDVAAGSAASLPAAGPGASAHVAAPSVAAPEARAHEQEATPSDAKRARIREVDDAVEQGEDAPPGLDDDAAFAAMMGFSSFGSSKKSR